MADRSFGWTPAIRRGYAIIAMTGMVMVVWVSQGRWVLVPWWADSLMVECMVWIGRVGDACLGGTAVWWSWCLAPMLSWRSGYVQQRLWSSAGQSMRSHSVAELLHIRRRRYRAGWHCQARPTRACGTQHGRIAVQQVVLGLALPNSISSGMRLKQRWPFFGRRGSNNLSVLPGSAVPLDGVSVC